MWQHSGWNEKGSTGTGTRGNSVGGEGYIFYKSWGRWVGGLSWLRGSERKETWAIVLEGLFCFPCLFFLLCLAVIVLVLFANELNFVKYETVGLFAVTHTQFHFMALSMIIKPAR